MWFWLFKWGFLSLGSVLGWVWLTLPEYDNPDGWKERMAKHGLWAVVALGIGWFWYKGRKRG